jgi:hypothetical protein
MLTSDCGCMSVLTDFLPETVTENISQCASFEVAHFCSYGSDLGGRPFLLVAFLQAPQSGLPAAFSPDFGEEGTEACNVEMGERGIKRPRMAAAENKTTASKRDHRAGGIRPDRDLQRG